MRSIYLIGSLRNRSIIELGNDIRKSGIDVFDSWLGASPDADDSWQDYANRRGLSYQEALADYGAQCIFNFDKYHLDRCDGSVLVMPAGKSGHIELGYTVGRGKPAWVLFDKMPERFDVMYNFTKGIFFEKEKLIEAVREYFKEDTSVVSIRRTWSDQGEIIWPKLSRV